MKQFCYNKILIFTIIIGLFAALYINLQRHQVEERNNTIELVMDYEDLLELAEKEGMEPSLVLERAKEAGITSLAVYETTFKKLNVNGKVSAVPGSKLLASYASGGMDLAWQELVKEGKIKGTEVYILGHDKGTFMEVEEDLIRRLGKDRVSEIFVGGEKVLAVKANYEALEKMDLGMPTDELKMVNEAGFWVVARPTNYLQCTRDDVDAFFKRLEGSKVSAIVFSGSQTLGSPKESQYVAEKMAKGDITLGMIEGVTQLQFYQQDGMLDIAKALDYKGARLYSIPEDEQKKMKISDAVARWDTTNMERNIRINLLKTFDKPASGMSLLETNMVYISSVRDILIGQGYHIGRAGVFESFYPSTYLRALVVIGVAAGIVLYLSLIMPALKPRYVYMLFALLAIGFAIPVLMGHGNKIRLLAALGAANVFPAIAVIWQLDRIRDRAKDRAYALPEIIGKALVALFICGSMSYVGAAYLSGALSDVEYFLEVNIYRGIKLTFVLPIILVGIAFLQRFDVFDGKMDDTQGFLDQCRKMLDMPVKVKTLLGLFLVLIAGIVFVGRSGHTMGMPVPAIELKFRAFLEQVMYARPRSKEMLIGHPAFMLAAFAWARKGPTMLIFILVLLATIAQGSMVETFAHMRTPVYMSFVRGIGGIVLGGLLGAIAMVFVELWLKYVAPKFQK